VAYFQLEWRQGQLKDIHNIFHFRNQPPVRGDDENSSGRGEKKAGGPKPLKRRRFVPLFPQGSMRGRNAVKVTKDNIAGRYFTAGLSGAPTSRKEPEPVHTIVADRDAAAHEHAVAGQDSRRARPDYAPPIDGERRKHERRQRQRKVLLDTRVMPSRRQLQSIDQEA
jgi:hypothetical protein